MRELATTIGLLVALTQGLPGHAQTTPQAPDRSRLVVDFGFDYFRMAPPKTSLFDAPEQKLVERVKEFWSLPPEVESAKGRVVATLTIDEHGAVSDISISQPSAIEALDTAVSNALVRLNPTPLQPEECPPQRRRLTVTVYYNEASTPGALARPAGWPPHGGVSAGNGVTDPRLLKEVKPNYTRLAMKAGIQGKVEMDAIVRTDGTVSDAVIVRSLDQTFGLDQQALQAVSQWRFTPGTRSGEPVDVIVSIELTFTLR